MEFQEEDWEVAAKMVDAYLTARERETARRCAEIVKAHEDTPLNAPNLCRAINRQIDEEFGL